jgi:hypothetical protein
MAHTIEEWESKYDKVGSSERYTVEQIKEYKQYIDICKLLQSQL